MGIVDPNSIETLSKAQHLHTDPDFTAQEHSTVQRTTVADEF